MLTQQGTWKCSEGESWDKKKTTNQTPQQTIGGKSATSVQREPTIPYFTGPSKTGMDLSGRHSHKGLTTTLSFGKTKH